MLLLVDVSLPHNHLSPGNKHGGLTPSASCKVGVLQGRVLYSMSVPSVRRTAWGKEDQCQEGFLILQLALHCVEDVSTLQSISSVSVACYDWVKGHARDYLPVYISHELLRQEARWERALTRQQVILGDTMQHRVQRVITAPMQWLCKQAGVEAMQQPVVAQHVLHHLPALPETHEVICKTLAQAGLRLTDTLVVQAAKAHIPYVPELAGALANHSPVMDSAGNRSTGLSGAYVAVLLSDPEWLRRYHKYEVTAATLPDLLSIACSYSNQDTLTLLVDLGAVLPQMKLLAGQTVTQDEAMEAAIAAVVQHAHTLYPGDPMRVLASISCVHIWSDKVAWGNCMADLLESCVRGNRLKFNELLRLPACHAIGTERVVELLRRLVQEPDDMLSFLSMKAGQIGALTRLQGAKDIAADDIQSLVLDGIAQGGYHGLHSLLHLPEAQHITTQQILEAVDAVVIRMTAQKDTRHPDLDDLPDFGDDPHLVLLAYDRLLGAQSEDGRQHITSWLRTQYSAARADVFAEVLAEIDTIQPDELFDGDDVADLVQAAMLKGYYQPAQSLLKLETANNISPEALSGLLETLLDADGDQNTNNNAKPNKIQVLDCMLGLDSILLISDQQAQQFVQGAVRAKWAWALHALSVRSLPLKAAWKALGPVYLTAALVYFVGDDDFPEVHFPFVDELVSHPALRQLSGHQLTSVIDTALAARQRGSSGILDPSMSQALGRLAAATAVAARRVRIETKITDALLSLLLMLPAVDEVSADVLQRWIKASMSEQQADCVPRLLCKAAASELPKAFVLDLVRFCVSGVPRRPVELLAKVLVHPVIAQGDIDTTAVVKACIDSCSPAVRSQLIGLPGTVARLLSDPESQMSLPLPILPLSTVPTCLGPPPQPQQVQLLGKLEQVAHNAPTEYAWWMAQDLMLAQIDLVDVPHALMPSYGDHMVAFPLAPATPVVPKRPGLVAWEHFLALQHAAPLFIDLTKDDHEDADEEEEWNSMMCEV